MELLFIYFKTFVCFNVSYCIFLLPIMALNALIYFNLFVYLALTACVS